MNGTNDNAGQNQVLAIGAMVLLVVVALVVGGGLTRGSGDRDALAAIETGADHIDSDELAARLLAGDDLLLVDVRPAAEFAAFHLPRAVNLSVPELCGPQGQSLLGPGRATVIYSNGPAHAAQAWSELRRLGHRNVRSLAGGLDEFKARILTPASLREGGSEAQAKAEATAMALKRLFFLTPVTAPVPPDWATDPAELTAPTVVSARWLHERLDKVAVLDTRASAADFAALHVTGAVHFPDETMRDLRDNRLLMLKSAPDLAAALGKAGIANETPVVIYADDKMQDATLGALALLRAGHRRLAILEGGLSRWAAEQRPLQAGAATPEPRDYRPVADADDFTITTDALHASLGTGMQLLDVRPADFFRGDKSTEARPGHIPGAVNRTFQKDLVKSAHGHNWRPRAELEQEYAALGLRKEQPITVTCRTGHQASESYFVLRHLLGYPHVRWHNGAWTEWAERKDLPAVMGDK